MLEHASDKQHLNQGRIAPCVEQQLNGFLFKLRGVITGYGALLPFVRRSFRNHCGGGSSVASELDAYAFAQS